MPRCSGLSRKTSPCYVKDNIELICPANKLEGLLYYHCRGLTAEVLVKGLSINDHLTGTGTKVRPRNRAFSPSYCVNS
jgi:hypothetical protein